MPISSNPEDTYPAQIAADKGKPDRPIFNLRFIVAKQTVQVGKLIEKASKENDDEKAIGVLESAIGLALSSIEGPNTEDKTAGDLLSVVELYELAGMVQTGQIDEEISRKKQSASAVGSLQGPSVSTVPAASA